MENRNRCSKLLLQLPRSVKARNTLELINIPELSATCCEILTTSTISSGQREIAQIKTHTRNKSDKEDSDSINSHFSQSMI